MWAIPNCTSELIDGLDNIAPDEKAQELRALLGCLTTGGFFFLNSLRRIVLRQAWLALQLAIELGVGACGCCRLWDRWSWQACVVAWDDGL
jgi:hypothetical protein